MIRPASTALLIVDLQNDFVHPDGAYGRAGQTAPTIALLPKRVLSVANAVRAAGGWIVSTQFTLVPGKTGVPFISGHLQKLRPFLTKGDFCPGAWGHQLVDELQLQNIHSDLAEQTKELYDVDAVTINISLIPTQIYRYNLETGRQP